MSSSGNSPPADAPIPWACITDGEERRDEKLDHFMDGMRDGAAAGEKRKAAVKADEVTFLTADEKNENYLEGFVVGLKSVEAKVKKETAPPPV